MSATRESVMSGRGSCHTAIDILGRLRYAALGLLVTMISSEMRAQNVFNEVDYSESSTTFRLNAPSGKVPVKVRLYKGAADARPYKTIKLKDNGYDSWEATVKGDLEGLFYTFDTGHGECPGTFAKAVGVNGKRGVVVDMRDTDPEGWDEDRRPTLNTPVDMVVYELHHRDFSIHPQSGYQRKGKFLTLTEEKALHYLKTLGVTAVQILPSYDYATVDEADPERPQYNWGYDPQNYNVPEGSYSTDANNPLTRIREFKQMVQALHKAGIRVILDVVYNHCMDIEHSNFQLTYPDYYFRKKRVRSSDDVSQSSLVYSDGSGCGNETASEKALMRRFMIESVKYWITEYHIDGFRFDLMGVHDIETMNAIRAEIDRIDPTITMYGEGWSAGECALPQERLAMKAAVTRMRGIGAFGDEMRDAVRGPFNDDHKAAWLAANDGNVMSLRLGLVGGVEHPQVDMSKVNYSTSVWCGQPSQHVSYVSCHDDMCLVDRLRTSMPGIDEDELIRLDKLAQTTVLISQGVPFVYAGEEALRDKKGVHNSYKSPDEVNAIDWTNIRRYPDVFMYYKSLIEIRKRHKVFRLGDADMVRRCLRFIDTTDNVVAFSLDGEPVGDSWRKVVCVLNPYKESRAVTVPEGAYRVVCRDGMACEEGFDVVHGGEIRVGAQQALIMYAL